MLPQRTLLASIRGVCAHAIEMNVSEEITEERARVTITFLREGEEMPPRVVIENIEGRATLWVWADRQLPYIRRIVISEVESPDHNEESTDQAGAQDFTEDCEAEQSYLEVQRSAR